MAALGLYNLQLLRWALVTHHFFSWHGLCCQIIVVWPVNRKMAVSELEMVLRFSVTEKWQ